MGLMGDWPRGKQMKDPVRGTGAGRRPQPLDEARGGVDDQAEPRRHGRRAAGDRRSCRPEPAHVEWDELRTHADQIDERSQMIVPQLNGGGAAPADGRDLAELLRAAVASAEGSPQVIDLSVGEDPAPNER
jgi:hypothetical protein